MMLHSIFKSIRNEWCRTGRLILPKSQAYSEYLDQFSQESSSDCESKFEDMLQSLQKASLIEIQNNNIISKIPFDTIVSEFLPALECQDIHEKETPESIKKLLHNYIDDPKDYIYSVLEQEGIITFTKNGFVSSCRGQELLHLTDIVLTQIEIADSKQIQYGIYETKVTAAEILQNSTVPNDQLKLRTEYAIRRLKLDGYLLPIDVGGNIRNWVFRSRIAEITRLVQHDKQRMGPNQPGKYLVRSLKLEVRDRQYPKRSIPIHNAVENLRAIAIEEQIDVSKKKLDKSVEILEKALISSGYTAISEYQERAFETIFRNLLKNEDEPSGFVLTAGTGMGKTLSYTVPLLFYCLLQSQQKGVKSLNIYPRIRLAENQLAHFAKLLTEINKENLEKKIRIGIDYTGTPYSYKSFSNSDRGIDKLYENGINRLWPHHNGKGYSVPYLKCPSCGESQLGVPYNVEKGQPLKCFSCGETIDWISYTKECNYEEPPDILIITTEMLNKHLLSKNSQAIFGDDTFSAPKMIMIDEIHLHTSLKGSHIAMLLRRLLNRINLWSERQKSLQGQPYVIGLSATIGKPKEFFEELTGIPSDRIIHEEPNPHELEKQGAEYFLFVKPEISTGPSALSSLIQTVMCVLHNMPFKSHETSERFKALGFVDSLDLVSRWSHDLDDAEMSKHLYSLRDPNQKPYKAYLPKNSAVRYDCSRCEQQINLQCPAYVNGECWWFMRYGNQEKKSFITPLKVESLTAGGGNPQIKYDLMVTTSAMEVGYDDKDIMCIVQYQSPMNLASFSQRKGRAGRGLRNRPITIAVLSPYKTKDVFYYHNHHYLTDPSFEKPPLNAKNLSIMQIHGFFALLDEVAFSTHNRGIDNVTPNFPFAYSLNSRRMEQNLLQNNSRRNINKVLGNTYPEEMFESIYSLYESLSDDLSSIWGKIPQSTTNSTKRLALSQILPDKIPQNLFTTLNLPAVHICDYYPQSDLFDNWERCKMEQPCSFQPDNCAQFLKLIEEHVCNTNVVETSFKCKSNCRVNYLEQNVDINLGLSTASPGKVTLRYQSKPAWIPPVTIESIKDSVKQVDIGPYYLQTEEHKQDSSYNATLDITDVPQSLQGYLSNSQREKLSVYRPDYIRLKSFVGKDGNSDWIYTLNTKQVYHGVDSPEYKKQGKGPYIEIDKSSVTYPQGFYTTHLDTTRCDQNEMYADIVQTQSRDEEYTKIGVGPFSKIFSALYFANAETKQYVNAVHAIVGYSGTLKSTSPNQNKNSEEIRFGLCKKEEESDEYQDVALGYKLVTDGIEFHLDQEFITNSVPNLAIANKPLYDDLLVHIFMSELYQKNRNPKGMNSFILSAFLSAYLYLYRTENYSSDFIAKCAINQTQRHMFSQKLQTHLETTGEVNPKSIEQIKEFFQTEGSCDFLLEISRLHKEILEQKNTQLIRRRITDIFVHSLKHTLKSACITLGGFENERDVLGWVELSSDFDQPSPKICLFEHGMYGTGGFRTIYQKYKNSPLTVWNHIFSVIENCPTNHEEVMLRSLLANPDEICEKISFHVGAILSESGTSGKEEQIESLVAYIQKDCNLYVEKNDLGQILRIFEPTLELLGQNFTNWRLYKELNITITEELAERLGRTPSSAEIKQRCYETICKKENMICPSWISLVDFLINHSTLSNSNSDLKKALFTEMDHRLLNTCIDGCPSCLQTNCDLDSNPKSRHLLLSRRLLKQVLDTQKDEMSLLVDGRQNVDVEKILNTLSKQGLFYIQYTKQNFVQIAQLIAKCVGKSVQVGAKSYIIYVHSDRYLLSDKKRVEPLYELCLALKKVVYD